MNPADTPNLTEVSPEAEAASAAQEPQDATFGDLLAAFEAA